MKKHYFALLFCLFAFNIYSQGTTCSTADPFCAGGAGLTYNNTTGVPNTGTINCLGTTPNPAWFYLQIAVAGNLNFTINQTSTTGGGLDVDYGAWGPFTSPAAGCTAIAGGQDTGVIPGVPATPTTGCSYSTAATEFLNIPNAQVGQIYMVLITNFSNQVGTISLTQTNAGQVGAGATDCNIVCPLSILGAAPPCPQTTLTAVFVNSTAPTYQWYLNGVAIVGATGNTYDATVPGNYSIIANSPGCVTNSTASVVVPPAGTPPITTPPANLSECGPAPAFFDLTQNDAAYMGLDTSIYSILGYFNTLADAQLGANPIATPTNYSGADGETVYIAIEDSSGGCITVISFDLLYLTCNGPVTPPDLVVCDDASNDGFATFDFTPQVPIILGANNASDYMITFHLTQADADNDANPISPITAFTNTVNPQIIYIRMETNADPTAYGTTSFQLIVNALPIAAISGNTTICPNNTAVITFTGTPNATVTYNIDGGAAQTIVLNGSGTATLTTPVLTSSSTYNLVSVANSVTTCSQAQSGSATVTVSPLPTATISGTASICQNGTNPVVTFTGAGGTAPYTFTYNINGGASQTIATTAGNSVTISAPTTATGTFAYNLVSVLSSGTPACSQAQSGTATVTVGPLPTATVSGTTTICQNGPAPVITFTGANGTAPYTFTYNINGGATQTITTTSGDSVTVSAPTTSTGVFDYNLLSVSANTCSQPQSGTATVTVGPSPTATIAGTATVCLNSVSPSITFTGAGGTAPYTFTYNLDGGASQNVTTTSGNSVTVNVPTTATGTFVYTLESVQDAATCSQAQSGSASVTVIALPTATVSGDVTVCQNAASPNITFTGAGGTAPYTFTYNINGGATQSVTTTAGNSVTVSAPTTTVGSFAYNLLSVQGSGVTPCSQLQSGTATVIVSPLPTAIVSGDVTVCQNGASPSVTFTGANGTAPYTFTYNINGGANQSVTTASGNSVTVSVPTAAVGTFAYNLVSVQDGASVSCSQAQSGTATVIVTAPPTATVSGTATVCLDAASPVITFTGAGGTAPYTFTYNINGGPSATVTTTSGTSATVSVATGATGVFIYTLESVQDAATCSQAQSGSASVTVIALPTATIAGDVTVCQNAASPNITFTGAGGTAPYTFTYNINGGANQSATTASGNSVTVSVPTTTVGSFAYNLVSVQGSGVTPCAQLQSGTATVIVSPLPTATVSGTVTVCQNDAGPNITFTGAGGTAPYTFTYNINGGAAQTLTTTTGNSVTVSAPTTATGTFAYNLVSVQDGAAVSCSQAQSGTATVTVSAPPVIGTPSDYDVCDDNNDGFSCLFDLTIKDSEITLGNPGLTVTYHETADDAQNGVNAIPAGAYCNIVSLTQTIYVAVSEAGAQCPSFTSFELHVNPRPVANPSIADYELCDVNSPGDLTEGFDLASMDTEVLNGQTGVVVSYHLSLADAQGGVNDINTAIPYNNITPTQQIWVNLTNAATGCQGTGSFNIVVNPLPAVTAPAPMNACGDSSGVAQFSLSSNDMTVSGGVPGMSVAYYLNMADATSGTGALSSPYTNISNPQTLVVVVTNVSTGCFDTTTLTLNVNQGPAAATPSDIVVCDPNSDGFESFDLESATAQVSGGAAGITVTYHETLADAQNGTNDLVSPYFNIVAYDQDIYVSVENDTTGCVSVVVLHLHVNDTPVATTPSQPLVFCDTDGDGLGVFDLTTAYDDILGSLDATQHTVVYYLSQADAQAGVNPITNLLAFPNTTNPQTIWAAVTNTATGCFDIVPVELVVNPQPVVPFPAPTISLCDDPSGDEAESFDIAAAVPAIVGTQTGMVVTFHLTQGDADAGINPLASPYTNITNAQTLFVRVENDATGCFATTLMDIRVEPLPTLTAPDGPVTECDADGNGFEFFDLDLLTADLLMGAPDITIAYYETEVDAINGVNPIVSPYENITPLTQFIWAGAVNTVTGCKSQLMIELNAVPSPDVPALDNLTSCDTLGNAQDGFTNFDLTVQTPVILAAQSGSSGAYTVGYYLSQADAQAGVAPIIPANNYINTSNPQTIWVGIRDNDNECFDTGSFELIVNTPLALTTPAPLSLCDDGATTAIPQVVFDLTIKENEILGGATGYTVTFYPSQADALAGVNAIVNPTAYTNVVNPQTLGVQVTSLSGGCSGYTTMDIRVLPLPTPLPDPQPLEACDDNLPAGTEIFDLTTNEAYIADGDLNLTFEYYTSQTDAQAGINMIATPTAYEGSGTIIIKVINSQVSFGGDNCYALVEQLLIVNPLPEVVPLVTYTICDTTASGTAVFTLSSQNDDVLALPQVVGDFTFAYYLTAADALAGTSPLADSYTNITNPQDIYVSVVNNATGCVNATGIVTLQVAAGAISAAPTAYQSCDTDTDGVATLDLVTLFNTEVLAGQDPALFTVTYYPGQADALAGTNAIATPSAYDTPSATLYAVVTNTTTLCDSAPVAVSITIQPLPNPVVSSPDNVICVNFGASVPNNQVILYSGLSAADHTFQWFLGGVAITGATNSSYVINTIAPGDYSVVATSTSALGCVSAQSAPLTVIQSGPAVAIGAGYTMTGAFSDNQVLTVTVDGYGDYVYSLDGGPFLDNGGIFTGVGPGMHTVTVHDANSCQADLVIDAINVIDYPPYFTPNGDGIHDTWNIIGLENQPSTKIYIFDRYGKLLKQISSTGAGWDGTYNGQSMPSTDYWFTVFYPEGGTTKEFKAHFSLKR